MAYIADQNDPNAQQQPGGTQGAPMNQPPMTATGGGANTSTTAGSPQGAASVTNTTQAPPTQDLGAYLKANAPQAVQMGQNIGQNLTDQAGNITGDVNNAINTVQGQVQANDIVPNRELVTNAANDPVSFVQNDQNLTDFLAQENAAYNGPAAFEQTPEYSKANAQVTNAVNAAPDISKASGIDTLVRGQETNPTLGMQNLDSLLLQGNADARAPIQGGIQKVQDLSKLLPGASSGIASSIKKAADDAAASKAGVNSAFLTGDNAVVPAWETGLTNAENTAASNYSTAGTNNNAIISILNGNDLTKLTPDQLSTLGLTSDQAKELQAAFNAYQGAYGSPSAMSNYLIPGTIPSSAPTLAQTATPADYAKEAALEQLLGSGYQPFLDKSNASQSGIAGSSTAPNFDKKSLAEYFSTNAINNIIPGKQGDFSKMNEGEKLNYLALLSSINKAEPQSPGQLDYLSPNVISLIDALQKMQGDLLPNGEDNLNPIRTYPGGRVAW